MGYGDCNNFMDASAIVQNPDNFCFLTDCGNGGYIVNRLDAGLYECHSLAIPCARGKPMLRLMRDGFEFLFLSTEAVELVTKVPDGNPAADQWAQIAGFRKVFRREAFFPMMGQMVGAWFGSLSYVDWALAHKPNIKCGQLFHELLHKHGLADHPEDLAHDAMVGATITASIEGKNLVKAVSLYNRYAIQAGYMPSRILSLTPPTIDTGDAIISVMDGEVQVLQTRVCETQGLGVVSELDGEVVSPAKQFRERPRSQSARP